MTDEDFPEGLFNYYQFCRKTGVKLQQPGPILDLKVTLDRTQDLKLCIWG